MKRSAILLAALALTVPACGESAGVASTRPSTTSLPPTSTTSTTLLEPGGVYAGFGTILDKEGVGPQLCSAVARSLPPQCQGLPVVGLDWGEVPWSETAGDTTWATAGVVGTFDGSALTLTEAPTQDSPIQHPNDTTDFTSPCPVPDGGWAVVDAGTATNGAFEQARAYAEAQPGFSGLWVDNLDPLPNEDEYGPDRFVANFSFTSDLDVHRSALAAIYGGPMCVSAGVRPLAELRDLQARVFDAIFTPQAEAAGIFAGFGASGSSNQFTGKVEVSVMAVAGDRAQAWLDEQFGRDTVDLQSFLQPYDGTANATPMLPDPVTLGAGLWVDGTTYDLSAIPPMVVSTGTTRPVATLPAPSPDGSMMAEAGPEGDSSTVVLRAASGELFQSIEVFGVREPNVMIRDAVWESELTLLVLVESWFEGEAAKRSWGVYQCDLDDSGCYLQQVVNFDGPEVALVDLDAARE